MPLIRAATERDAAAIADIYAPAVTDAPTSFELVPPSPDEMGRRMSAVLEVYPWLVIEDAGAVCGYAYATRHRERAAYQWSAEVSAYVRSDCHRRGFARSLYEKLFELLAAQGFHNAYAGITIPNAQSVGFHEALGFELIGVYRAIGYKFGGWHDVVWYGKRLTAPDAEPQPLIPFPEFRTTSECARIIEGR